MFDCGFLSYYICLKSNFVIHYMSKTKFRSRSRGLSKMEERDSSQLQREKLGEYAHYRIR